MNVFITWSGSRSQKLARALKSLLPDVIQNLDVWMSEHDIQAGTRWAHELATRLDECNLGIACVTPENQNAPWLMFEAGALSKNLAEGRLIPLLLDIKPAQINFPLAQFQLAETDRKGITKILIDVNSLSAQPMEKERLLRQLDRLWPEFDRELVDARAIEVMTPVVNSRSQEEVLYEILDRVRDFGRLSNVASKDSGGLWIDTRPFLGPAGKLQKVADTQSLTASDLLDIAWKLLDLGAQVPPLSYGERWLLVSKRTGEKLTDIAREYVSSRGQRRDTRPLDMCGLGDGDTLEVVPVGPFEPLLREVSLVHPRSDSK